VLDRDLLSSDLLLDGKNLSVVQCAGRIGHLTTTFVIAWPDPSQSPEPDHHGLSEVEPTSKESTHFGKDLRLSLPVKGMYPLLDLITEHGSSGLGELPFHLSCTRSHNISVDKVVIAQESLQEFINALSPGAYSSITEVNFKILDSLVLKPLGIYGSKEEIVRFLCQIGAVDDKTYVFALFSSCVY
jgi:hypothetical protein